MKILLMLSVLISSCSSYLTLKDTSKTFPADFNSTFSAAVDYCKSNGIAIRTIDRENGIITTEYSSTTERRYNFNIVSRGDSTLVSVTLYKTSINGTENPMQYSDFLPEYNGVFTWLNDGLLKNKP
jgi:hypothetical protein